ncbi:hypothetical protein BRAS3843_450010 [Bradyrhizobium sp. STM 3843]|nr:hypothetical protein BRAS3843_450010 [Bradyrhizobium sp. STM 3843]
MQWAIATAADRP